MFVFFCYLCFMKGRAVLISYRNLRRECLGVSGFRLFILLFDIEVMPSCVILSVVLNILCYFEGQFSS